MTCICLIDFLLNLGTNVVKASCPGNFNKINCLKDSPRGFVEFRWCPNFRDLSPQPGIQMCGETAGPVAKSSVFECCKAVDVKLEAG